MVSYYEKLVKDHGKEYADEYMRSLRTKRKTHRGPYDKIKDEQGEKAAKAYMQRIRKKPKEKS